MGDQDYYAILGVAAGSEDVVITAAYKALMKKYHPDTNRGNAAAEARAKKINEAYEVLRDPVRRAAYDASRSGGGTPPPPPSPPPRPPGGSAPPKANQSPTRPFKERPLSARAVTLVIFGIFMLASTAFIFLVVVPAIHAISRGWL